MSIRLLTFDLDDTLWESRPVLLQAEMAMLQWLAAHRPRLQQHFDAEQLRAFRLQVATQRPDLRVRISALRREALRLALLASGDAEAQAEAGAEQAFQVFIRARQQVVFYEDVLPTLAQLQQRYRLVAITNGNADPAQIGLDTYFEFSLSPDQLGVAKPDPEPFLVALQRTGCSPAETIHIGDHPEDDMAGARNAGLRTLWANLRGAAWTADWRPDGEIRHWRELLPALQRIDAA